MSSPTLDYAGSGKPQIDWDDPAERDALIDSRSRDALALLAVLDGRELDDQVGPAAQLLASVVGQDIINDGGVFGIARRVASDRVISTVDPDARHGHKTQARGFDGYKGHIAADPDSEIITATTATPGNSGDAEVAEDPLADNLPSEAEAEAEAGDGDGDGDGDGPAVYGDAAYGAGACVVGTAGQRQDP